MNARGKAVRVVKLGGSLLAWPACLPRLADWLQRQHEGFRNVLIVGGGDRVEQLRRDCQQGALDDVTAHWRAIRIMDENLLLAKDRLTPLLPPEIACDCSFRVESFLREIEPQLPGVKLPVGWSVTSDSIAARIAQHLQASELVLLKSMLPSSENVRECAGEGYVDAFFPQAIADNLRLRAVNLRDKSAFDRA